MIQIMEAGGIEPPSRDVSEQASTCVVDHFNLAWAVSERQDTASASPAEISRQPHRADGYRQPTSRRSRPLVGVAGRTGYRFLGSHAQLRVGMYKFLPGDLPGPPASWARRLNFYPSGRSQSPPRKLKLYHLWHLRQLASIP